MSSTAQSQAAQSAPGNSGAIRRQNTSASSTGKSLADGRAAPSGLEYPGHVQRQLGNAGMAALWQSGTLQRALGIQAKMTVGAVDDELERAADVKAEQIMSMRDADSEATDDEQLAGETDRLQMHGHPLTISRMYDPEEAQAKFIQRACAKCEEEAQTKRIQRDAVSDEDTAYAKPIQRNLAGMGGDAEESLGYTHAFERSDEEEDLGTTTSLYMKANDDGAGPVTAEVESGINSLRNRGGISLPDSERSFFEPRFGRDFSDVRVHTGPDAAQIARSINARAFTIGRDVVFGANEYRPGTTEGRRLMAHELTHTVQQGVGKGLQRQAIRRQEKLRRTISIGASGMSSMGTRSSVTGPTEATEEYSDEFKPMVDPTTGECKSARIQVRATHIGGALSTLPIWHLLIVHTNHNGFQTFYRGGPGNRCHRGAYGGIQATYGEFKRGTVDWDPSSPRETVLEGPEACDKTECLETESKRIQDTCTPYRPLGPNSNTFVGTLLEKCKIPRKKPVWIAPGFNDRNL